MKKRRTNAKTQICPRCGMKLMEGIDTCPDCGLVFSRLEMATNKEAKRKKLRFDRDYIIKTNKIPSDVKYYKLLLLCIFLGPFGAHNFYVGRYLKGSILLGDFFVLLMLVIFNSNLTSIDGGNFLGALSTICGLVMLMWFWDLLMIITKKYKIPVAIDLESENSDRTIREDIQEVIKKDELEENTINQVEENKVVKIDEVKSDAKIKKAEEKHKDKINKENK